MKRIRKFRGKSSESRKWVYGYLFEDVKPRYRFAYIIDATFVPALSMPSSNFIEVIPETVGQFTGYEMRAVDVYFGDLVSNNYESDKEVIREIVLHNGCIMMKRVKGKSRLPKLISLYEHFKLNYRIIGNIHDK